MLKRFRGEKLLDADMKLKSLWQVSFDRHFQYQLDDRLSHLPSTIHHGISTRMANVSLYPLNCAHFAHPDSMTSHPYHRLRQACASRSKLEDELHYCYNCTQLPLAPTMDDTNAYWLIDWEPIIRMLRWKESFSDHDSVASALMTADSSTHCMLSDLCHAITNVVSREHRLRMNQLVLYYKVEDFFPKSSMEQSRPSYWANMIYLFHDSQLRSLQKIVLEVWIENRATIHTNNKSSIPELAESDRFMFQFVSEQLTRPFLQMTHRLVDRRVIWRKLIQQYTTSLCCDINSLIHPSKLNPIAHILNPGTIFVSGTDGHTRFMMLRSLVSTARSWVEFLVGLQRESSALFEVEGGTVGGYSVTKYDNRTQSSALSWMEGAATSALIAVMNDCKEQDTEAVTTDESFEMPVTEALATLFKMMKHVGAMNLLTQERQRLFVANPSHLNSIRLIDDTLQFDVDSWVQMEEQEEVAIDIDSCEAVLKHLIFPYLDYKDLVQPVCKLWTKIGKCNLLWKSLYHSHFGTAPIQWSIGVEEHDWKLHFRYAVLTS